MPFINAVLLFAAILCITVSIVFFMAGEVKVSANLAFISFMFSLASGLIAFNQRR